MYKIGINIYTCTRKQKSMKRKVDIERNFTRAFFYRHIANIELCRSSAILVLVKVAATFRWSSRLEAQDFQRLSEVQRPENQPFLLYFGLQQVFKVVPQDGLRYGGCVRYDRKRSYRKGKGRSEVHVKRKLPKDYSEKGTCFNLVDILPTLKSLL